MIKSRFACIANNGDFNLKMENYVAACLANLISILVVPFPSLFHSIPFYASLKTVFVSLHRGGWTYFSESNEML